MGQRECHSTFSVLSVCCSHHHRDGGTDVCLSDSGCDSHCSACVCVCVCVHAFLAFCLGIALEQFTACHSFSMTGSKSERRRRMGGKERERATEHAGERGEINSSWGTEKDSERLKGSIREGEGGMVMHRAVAPLGAWVRAACRRSWHAAGHTVAQSLRQPVCSHCLPSERRGRREREECVCV